ncbi:MAG TPA: hypothetical protein VGM29_04985 [Polyangiaceae bacterium]|jgi:hypothetical protein
MDLQPLNAPAQNGGMATRPSAGTGASPATAEHKAPLVVSVSVKNECPNTVHVFYGKEPKFGSGREVALGGNSLQNQSFTPGDMIWVVDDQQNGIASANVSEGTHDVVVGCANISSR